MRIGLFVDAYIPEINGVVTSTKTLFDAFRAHGDDVYVVTTNPFNNKVMVEDNIIRIPGIEIKKLYGYRLSWIYNHKALNFIRKLSLDVIHVQTEASIGIFGRILAKKFNIPLVYTYHTMYIDYTYYVTKGVLDPLAKSVVKRLSKILANGSTEFITTSLKTKKALRSYGIQKYINVIPNGIDIARFDRSNYQDEDFIKYRKEHNLEDTFLILSLGRIAKEKSIDVCLKEYAEFLKTNSDIKTKFLIVGDGPAREELELLAVQLNIIDHVEFLGKVDHEMTSFYYNLCDLYISSSTSETQGLTFIEAMASSTLVLCRYDDNLNDVIIDGKTGFFFYKEEECHHLLSQIIKMPQEKKDLIIKDAYNNVQKYSIEKFYQSVKEVYNRAIRKRW